MSRLRSENKRQSTRFEVVHGEVGIKKAGLLGIQRADNTPFSLVNLSETGIQFICNKYHEKGNKFDISIRCPAFEHYLVGRAEVIWCRRTSKTRGLYRVGARFKKMSRETKVEIHRIAVDPLLRQVTKGSSYIG